MKRLRWVALIAGVLLLVGAAVWGLLFHLGPWLTSVTQGPPVPKRPPDLFGTVEKVGPSVDGKKRYLIRCQQPPPGVPESDQNIKQRKQGPLIKVWIKEQSPVRKRDGGPGEVAVGQTVSVWCSGEILESYPPQWGADYVIIETD